MMNNLANDITVSGSFLSTDRRTGERININYKYSIYEFVNAIHRGFNRNVCRDFIDKINDLDFSLEHLEVKDLNGNSKKPVFVRDADVLKLCFNLLDDPRHVLVFNNVYEEDTFIESLKDRFQKNVNLYTLVLTYKCFNVDKFDDVYKYAMEHNWSEVDISKLCKYIDCNHHAFGHMDDYSIKKEDGFTRITKTYGNRTISYNVYDDEDIKDYIYFDKQGNIISDRLNDYETIEDFIYRYVEDVPNSEIFDYDNFKKEALKIREKFPVLMDFDELMSKDCKEIKEYQRHNFLNVGDIDQFYEEMSTYINIILTLKSLMNNETCSLTRMLSFHRKVFIERSRNHKLTYKEFEQLSDDLFELEW